MRVVLVAVDMASPIGAAYALLQRQLGREFTHDERLAFFAGADFVYQLLGKMAQDEVPEEISQQIFSAIIAELEQHQLALRAEFESGGTTH